MTSQSPAKKLDVLPAGIDPAVLEVLASRVCHDLISPVGAVHNGVEFLQETGIEGGADAIALIAHSAQQASAKLQIFRLAYGAGGRDPNIKPEDVKKAFATLVDADGKIKQNWDPHAIKFDSVPLGFCKMLTGTLMLAQECLPKGGIVAVAQDGPNGRVGVIATCTDAAPRSQVREALARDLAVSDLDPRLVHPYVLGVLAAQYGFTVTIAEAASGRVTFHLLRA
jgi:histidine phosphotransferase ChpT